jgi:hypothetical protein
MYSHQSAYRTEPKINSENQPTQYDIPQRNLVHYSLSQKVTGNSSIVIAIDELFYFQPHIDIF